MVLFSHAFGISPANVALANRFGVTIFVLDPAGGESTKARGPGPGGVKALLACRADGRFRKLTTPSHIGEDLAKCWRK